MTKQIQNTRAKANPGVEIVRLQDNEKHLLPEKRQEYGIFKDEDELVAIEKFLIRHKYLPQKVYRWRSRMYFPMED